MVGREGPKTRRSGRRERYRKFLSSLYTHRSNSVEEPEVIEIRDSNDKLESTSTVAEYRLTQIDFGGLPSLPPLQTCRFPQDRRPRFYELLRAAILHYYYGGSIPSTCSSNVVWPAECSSEVQLRSIVRDILRREDEETVWLE